jgi:hypothetical protein
MRNKKDFIDEINLGFYDDDGGTTGEFCFRWVMLGNKPVPKIVAFDDSWDALWQFRDVLEKLAVLDDTNPTPGTIRSLLTSLGVEDTTKTKNPYEAE